MFGRPPFNLRSLTTKNDIGIPRAPTKQRSGFRALSLDINLDALKRIPVPRAATKQCSGLRALSLVIDV